MAPSVGPCLPFPHLMQEVLSPNVFDHAPFRYALFLHGMHYSSLVAGVTPETPGAYGHKCIDMVVVVVQAALAYKFDQ